MFSYLIKYAIQKLFNRWFVSVHKNKKAQYKKFSGILILGRN